MPWRILIAGLKLAFEKLVFICQLRTTTAFNPRIPFSKPFDVVDGILNTLKIFAGAMAMMCGFSQYFLSSLRHVLSLLSLGKKKGTSRTAAGRPMKRDK